MKSVAKRPPGWGMLLVGMLLLCAAGAALAGDFGMTYVKTLGQVCPALPMVTGGGRISVDERGFLYFGTPGPNSFLQKMAPDGRVVWRADNTHCAYTGTAVDDKYVYGCGIGYYGYGHLLRRKKESGVDAPGWVFVWPKATDVVNGVRGFVSPGALKVDGTYLYILDIGNGELRRLDKVSGVEKPFASPIKVDEANDIAIANSGTLLVLTKDSVSEFDRATGRSLRPKMIAGLQGAVAIAVNRQSGALFIGEGGMPDKPINKIRIFSSAGADTGTTIGRGGEWQGKWNADAFCFSCGGADIAFDLNGGFWSNCYAHRSDRLALMTHFSPAYKPDKVFLGTVGESVAADSDLSAYVGGNYKIDWDGNLCWTSGLVNTGKPNQFPTTLGGWSMKALYADAQRAIFTMVHHTKFVMVNPETGEGTGKEVAVPGSGIIGACVSGRYIYATNGITVYRTTLDLTPLETIFSVPDVVKTKGVTGMALNSDQTIIYLSAGTGENAMVYAFDGGGKRWEAKAGQIFTRYRGVLLTGNPAGPGLLALNADDGSLNGIFANKALDDRPQLWGISGAGVGSKDGADYLFVAAQYRVLVYRIAAGE